MDTLFQLDPNVDYLKAYLIPWSVKLLSALAVFVIGGLLAKLLTNGLTKLLSRAKTEDTLAKFLRNITYIALLLVASIAALDQLGVNTTSVIAVFATAGLAVGLALKDSLSNFASGMMIIIFRPFRGGDVIEAAGVVGIVEEITLFSTVMRSPDNRQIIVPNSQIYNGTIVNINAKPTRRIDMIFSISYDDDLGKARQLIWEVINSEDRILKEPEAAVVVAELADSSVNIAVRPWVNTPDYWNVRSDMLEKIKAAFDANSITIPFPQREMHIHPAALQKVV